ncbi:hypothetical protein ACFQZE_12385 [Paenibacillus sp. GCM10027627]|uniref:hypothetical protein n=1 Tax=unclassified Paenibacillus TaxID=185978 RepID=UPI003630446F
MKLIWNGRLGTIRLGGCRLRAIFMSLLLLITAVLIYTSAAEGETGLKAGLNRAGGNMADYIEGMSP